MIDYKKLIEAGVHFGHQKTRWCPKMKPYIWGQRKGVHLIDISKTAQSLEKAVKFLEGVAAEGKTILWVGTKPAAQPIIEKIGMDLNVPYISYRWVGGLLTNNSQVKKSVTKFLHYEDVLQRSDEFPYTKKELSILKKNVDRLRRTIGGIIKLSWPVGAVVVVDVKRESTAVKEALQCGVPVVALVDTNSDPAGIDYVIPGNDDSPKSVKLILDYLAEAVQKGQEVARKAKEAKKAAAEEEKAKEVKGSSAPKREEKIISKEKVAPKEKVETKAAKPKSEVLKKDIKTKEVPKAKSTSTESK
jgi:small subunit ribosomal protein S2